MSWSFLLTYHWPKQVTWPCLQPVGLRNITLDQEGAGNILTVSSPVMQRLFCLQPTPCPGVRGSLLYCRLFLLRTLFSKTTAQHLLSWSLLTCYPLGKAFPHHSFLSLLLYGFPYFQTVQSIPICLFMYMFTCTHVHTHTQK